MARRDSTAAATGQTERRSGLQLIVAAVRAKANLRFEIGLGEIPPRVPLQSCGAVALRGELGDGWGMQPGVTAFGAWFWHRRTRRVAGEGWRMHLPPPRWRGKNKNAPIREKKLEDDDPRITLI